MIARLAMLACLAVPSPTLADEREAQDLLRFCSNIADPARERRYALKQAELEGLQAEIDERMARLEERRAAYEEWRSKRDEFVLQAQDSLVAIYSRMRPDAAAERLQLLGPPLAAAIVMRLKPSLAGTILNEMDADAAARVSSVIAASGARDAGKSGS